MTEPVRQRHTLRDGAMARSVPTTVMVNESKEDDIADANERDARVVAQYLAARGFDANGEPLDHFSLLHYPVREWKFRLPGSRDPVATNPVVTLVAVASLWMFVLWACVDPVGAASRVFAWGEGLLLRFTWFYQLSKIIMFGFVLYVTYRYGHIHLGRDTDRPEYTTITYFCMIFTANIGASLLASSAADPLHLQTDHFYANAGYRSQDELDMFAINAVVNNWSIGSWTSTTLVAVCMALSGFCMNLPMVFRSCFFPILGTYTWGWMGDIMDALAIVAVINISCMMLATTARICTVGWVHVGLVDPNSTDHHLASIRIFTIWIISIVSVTSVLSGLRRGIQYVPLLAMSVGVILTLLLLLLDDTKFVLNLTIQEVGYFWQHCIFQLGSWTDAFGQLRSGSGRAVDGHAAEPWWTGEWPVNFQAWATCLSPVVGVFIAYISKGRRLWEVVLYTLCAPIVTILVWTCIWSGVSLRQSRQLLELIGLGERHFNNSGHFLAENSETCYNVPQTNVVMNGETIFTNYLPDVTPICSWDPDGEHAYAIFSSFRLSDRASYGLIMSIMYILACFFSFVAHSDSSTFIVDTLASNGRKNYHWSRRLFWAFNIAALSTVLESLSNVNAAAATGSLALLCSFPLAVLLCYVMQSTLLLCRAADNLSSGVNDETKYVFPDQPMFEMPIYGGVLNILEYVVSLGRVNAVQVDLGIHLPTRHQSVEFLVGLVLPFVSLYKVLAVTYPDNPVTNATLVLCYSVCFMAWVSLALASVTRPGCLGLSATFLLVSGVLLASIRSSFRLRYNIRSNGVADLVCGTFAWPQVLAQMRLYDAKPPTTPSSVQLRERRETYSGSEHETSS